MSVKAESRPRVPTNTATQTPMMTTGLVNGKCCFVLPLMRMSFPIPSLAFALCNEDVLFE